MIELIYGMPGCGKTEYIINALKDDAKSGKKAIVIVPEQMTVMMERQALYALPTSAQLHIEVLNFSRLANRVFRQHGGLVYNYASKGTKKLIMWRAVRTALPFLREYSNSARDDRSLADAILNTYKELQASGISAEALEEKASEMGDTVLSRKLKDISAIIGIYNTMLSEKYSDNDSDLSRLCNLLDNVKYFSGFNVYIDGFTSLTGQEHSVLKYILEQADKTCITFSIPFPTDKSIDTLTLRKCSDRTRRDIASLGLKSTDVFLEQNHRTKSPELLRVAEVFWQLGKSKYDPIPKEKQGDIELWRGVDIYDECEFAAVRARELIEQGYRMRDIAIIARNSDKYKGIIEPALDNMDLVYFVSDKTDAALCPVARLILSAIRVAIYGWRREDVIANLKTGLYPFSPRDCDIFESYTAKWNITGKRFVSKEPWNMNPDGYTPILSHRGKEVLSVANSLKDKFIPILRNFITSLRNAETVKELCAATYDYLETLSVYDSLIELSTRYLDFGQIREAKECARMYDVVLDALDGVCDAFDGEGCPDLQTFATALKTVLEESELGAIPTSGDEIIIGSANMLRASGVKCVIILGACDGEFPGSTQSTSLFSDSERDLLISKDLPLVGDRSERASDELFYFRRAVSSPTEKLIVFTRADSEPSIAFARFKAIFEYLEINETTADTIRKIRTYRAAGEYIPLLQNTAEGEALRRLFTEINDVTLHTFDYSNFPIDASFDTISPKTAEAVIGRRLEISQSKIEAYMGCKFAYACKYFLRLDDGKKVSFAYDSIGTFIHYIIEKFLLRVYLDLDGHLPDNENFDKLLDEIIRDYLEGAIPLEDGKQSSRLLHLATRLRKISKIVLRDIFDELADSKFTPTFFELPIGTKDIPSFEITLNDGTKMSLGGKVDRVDTYRLNGKTYIRVVDYKTGTKEFSLKDIEKGLNLQLLLYIYALTNKPTGAFAESIGGTPTAASIAYLSAVPGKVKALSMSSTDFTENIFRSEISRTGLIVNEPEIIDAISVSGNNRHLMIKPRSNSFIENDNLHLLYGQIETILREIGDEMIGGHTEARPMEKSGRCKFCRYAQICRAAKHER